MKSLLRKIRFYENEMNRLQEQSEYWLEEEHYDIEKSNLFEQEADVIYESLYNLLNQVAEKIVSITSGQIDKITAMTMIRCRQAEVEKVYWMGE